MYLLVKQLSKSFGGRPVVSNIDLAIEEGEILSLLGPSGCGKTTTLRMIAGLETPDSGWIQVGEQVLYDGKRETPIEERQMGMVFQDYALWPHMTVAQNISFGMRLHRFSRSMIADRVQELLTLVNLPGLGGRYPYQLSGGQQQRVAMARALATKPRILLLDEPLSNLDTGLRETMRTELVELLRRLNITTINVTHDQNEAMAMSDRIMILREGLVEQVGSPIELYNRPVNTFVASFMGRANLLSGEIIVPSASAQGATLRLLNMATELSADFALEQIRDGVQASLLCRPDDVRVYPDRPQVDHPNILPGSIAHTSFIGGRWHTFVRIGDDRSQSNGSGRDEKKGQQVFVFAPFQPQSAQRVWLELPPEHCQIIAV
ncbi:MAG: ABC transporter ATP-binding protein [Ktedonobacteraceae bacterium]